MKGVWLSSFCLCLLLILANGQILDEHAEDTPTGDKVELSEAFILNPPTPMPNSDASKSPVSENWITSPEPRILAVPQPVVPVSGPVEPKICSPVQVLYQKIQEQLAIIIQEIEKLQEEGRQKIAESERKQQANTVGLFQLWTLAQQLQNSRLSPGQSMQPPMGANMGNVP
ncbi:uncharacterized protein LOC131678460 [Topomyia yanbarensis]|uniref:uncharacterized protein LOC131678460 n=1 Tax=Topomyia yanbarensis TaxID=2498891 RepID=UPI00273BA3E9|nr:uncharacterized protein LOC131678460 [Topomyia yanbarensis]